MRLRPLLWCLGLIATAAANQAAKIQAAEIHANKQPAQLDIRAAGERSIRVTLKPMRWGGYFARVVVRRAELGGGAPAFVSASVQVGERSFASALSCTAGRRGRFGCRE